MLHLKCLAFWCCINTKNVKGNGQFFHEMSRMSKNKARLSRPQIRVRSTNTMVE